MEIERLDLIHWGKFSGHTIRLKSGVNIIYGGNESGKSTIHTFFRAMLYGTPSKEAGGRKGVEDKTAEPGGEGAMTIWDGGQRYEVHRTFGVYPGMLSVRQAPDSCAAEDLEEWMETEEPQEVLNDLLGYLDADTFENTVFWKQDQIATELFAGGLKNCLKAGAQGDRRADGEQAVRILEERRERAQQKKKKEAEALEEQIQKRQLEAEYVRREAARLQAQCNAVRNTGRETEPGEEQGDGFTEIGKNLIQMLLLLAGVLAVLGALLLQDLLLRIFLGIFGGAFLILFLPVRRFLTAREDSEEATDGRDFREEQLRAELRKKEDSYQKLQEELEKLYHRHMKTETADTEIAAFNLAIDRIRELSEEASGGPAGAIGVRASEILKELTGGTFDRITVELSGKIRVYGENRLADRRKISMSTMQQIQFAVRMAAGEVLAGETKLPFLLDEPFAMYDDERLRSVLSWLEHSGHQVILFTCQQRVRQIMDEVRRGERM